VAALRRGGHQVDDCDLYAEGFDPVMTAAERRAYNTATPDLTGPALSNCHSHWVSANAND